MTIKPCNRSCFAGIFDDKLFEKPKNGYQNLLVGKEIIGKSEYTGNPLYISPALKLREAINLAKCINKPRPIPKKGDILKIPLNVSDLFNTDPKIWSGIQSSTDIDNLTGANLDPLKGKSEDNLNKVIAAGSYNVAPSNLVQGAALQREEIGGYENNRKNRILAAFRDWDKSEDLRTWLKKKLSDVDDDYINKFVDLVGYYKMKKTLDDVYENTLLKQEFTPLDDIYLPLNSDFPQAKRELLFSKLAKSFFKLGKHVPNIKLVKHPQTKEDVVLQTPFMGRLSESPMLGSDLEIIEPLLKDGTLDKLAIMDKILGMNNRHVGNFLISDEKPFIFLIHNGMAFDPEDNYNMADFLNHFNPKYPENNLSEKPLHPQVGVWLDSLNEDELADHMRKFSVPDLIIDRSIDRLRKLKKLLKVRAGWSIKDALLFGNLGL
ncbi:MAG: hypothetical protein KGO96_07675 [Elusimicrobia bacterium]|nr:hypothetical protein [Elusimicrobiota bacterium]